MHPFRYVALAIAVYGTLGVLAHTNQPEPQRSPAIIGTVPETVFYAPVSSSSTTTSASTTSTTTAAPTTAHEALQADLEDSTAFALADLDPSLPCQEWAPLALKVGWPVEELPRLLRTIHRESRCQPLADSGPDHGLTQVNQIHRDYVEQLYGIPFEEAMLDPEKNLTFALRLWTELEAQGKCGWAPWSGSCS